MKELTLRARSGTSRIIVGASLSDLAQYCPSEKRVIITDTTVESLYSHYMRGSDVISISPGEESKSLETISRIYEKLYTLRLERSSFIIGVGGGAVCDVAGFAAATYLRGVRYGVAPTTLLAQVDASIGGKNGVNFSQNKNLIGTIRQPEFCLCDPTLLSSLSQQELSYGFAEIIKHAVVADEHFFSYLENSIHEAYSLSPAVTEQIIYSSLRVKAEIVSSDECESAERMKLNFGHTIGHALEMALNIPHGHAVSLGMVAEALLSVERKLLSGEDCERLIRLLTLYKLPVQISVNPDSLFENIARDKKRAGDMICLPLLYGIGVSQITPVTLDALFNSCRKVFS